MSLLHYVTAGSEYADVLGSAYHCDISTQTAQPQ